MDRLDSLGRCAVLTHQLSNPIGLQEGCDLIAADDRLKASTSIPNKNTHTGSSSILSSNIKTDKADTKLPFNPSLINTPTNKEISSENKNNSNQRDEKKSSFSNHWVQDLPSYGLNDALELHAQTIAALKDKSKWSLVGVPYNIAGAPVDIAQLNVEPVEADRNGRNNLAVNGKRRLPLPHLANAWANGKLIVSRMQYVCA